MEVDVVIDGQLAKNAILTDELHKGNSVDRRTLTKNKKYHVFFCYRDVSNDKLWVKEVVNKLENDYGYICYDHDRDFVPGNKIMDNIKDGIKYSEKVVSVLSKEGLDSEYLRLETEMAHREGIDKRENILIPVLLDNCEIPVELKLLTYIDARKEINEKTWWPKLIAAIESKGRCSFFKDSKEEETKHKSDDQPTFYYQYLCSLKTTFNFKQRRVQSTSKYIPWELASKDAVVPVETIKNIKRDLLDVPIIRCKQNCSCFVTGCFILFLNVWVVGFMAGMSMSLAFCDDPTTMSKENCILVSCICLVIEIVIGICCCVGWKFYYKEPRSLDKKIIEYNTELIKDGVLITLYSKRLWKTASIVFFRVSVEICKKYVLLHLKEDRKIEREKVVSISVIEAQHDEDDVPHLTGSRNEDLAQANETLHWRHDMKLETETFVDTSEIQEKHIADDVPPLAVSENEQLDQPTEVYQRNVGQRHMDDDQGSTIVNLSVEENGPQQFTQNSQFKQSSDLGNLENVAMTLLLKYAHEYLRLARNGKMKNPKEDRHKADYTCLCQYIEKTDRKFRKLVDRNKIILAKSSIIEDITQNKKRDAFRL